MRKRFDDVFAVLMLAAGVAVVLTGAWCLRWSIERAEAGPGPTPTPIPVAQPCIMLPEPEPEPTPEPTPYISAIPLSPELQRVLFDVCAEAEVPVALALGLVEVESCFMEDAVSAEGCYGLCQLNPLYFPADLSPADNLREGVSYLGRLLEQYQDTGAALTAYNAGYDTGSRGYADAVVAEAEWWTDTLEKEDTR